MNREVKTNGLFASRKRKKTNRKTKNHQSQSPQIKHTRKSAKSDSSRDLGKTTNIFSSQKSGKPSSPKHRQKSRSQSYKAITPFAVIFRLTIVAVGISTILGSGLAIANSFSQNLTLQTPQPSSSNTNINAERASDLETLFSLVSVGREIMPLRKQLLDLTQKYPQLEAGIFIADIADKSYVNIQGTDIFSSASTIKLPILVAFFQDVDAGKISLTETLVTTEDNIGSGSGYMQYQPVGSEFDALTTATKMITVSDNTATNMLIERLGGAAALNQRFIDWGLTASKIRNPLPDLTGTNTTSPEDLSNLLLKIDRGELVSLPSRDRMFQIMKQTETNTLLPQGIEQDATIAHKTGDIKSVLGDSGLIDLPSGKRYIASVLVKRPENDPQAKALIQDISRLSYQYFRSQSTGSSAISTQSESFLVE